MQHPDVVLLNGVRVVGQSGEVARTVFAGEGLNALFQQPVKDVFPILLHRCCAESGKEGSVEHPGSQHHHETDARDEQQCAIAGGSVSGD